MPMPGTCRGRPRWHRRFPPHASFPGQRARRGHVPPGRPRSRAVPSRVMGVEARSRRSGPTPTMPPARSSVRPWGCRVSRHALAQSRIPFVPTSETRRCPSLWVEGRRTPWPDPPRRWPSSAIPLGPVPVALVSVGRACRRGAFPSDGRCVYEGVGTTAGCRRWIPLPSGIGRAWIRRSRLPSRDASL